MAEKEKLKKKEDCIFCKIANGEIPSEKIYEDKDFYAFLDIRPINPGHVLVISKEHYENIFVMPPKLFEKYSLLVQKLGPKVKKALNSRWINVLIFGEEIKHAHIHIVPRFDGDNFNYPIQKSYSGNEEKETAEKIRRFL